MTWFDFISSLGGFCGLCLGISFVSVVEILYWFSIRPCRNFAIWIRTSSAWIKSGNWKEWEQKKFHLTSYRIGKGTKGGKTLCLNKYQKYWSFSQNTNNSNDPTILIMSLSNQMIYHATCNIWIPKQSYVLYCVGCMPNKLCIVWHFLYFCYIFINFAMFHFLVRFQKC